MIVPLLVSRFASGWGPRDLGFRVKGAHREILLALGLWLAFVPVVLFISDTPSFAAKYPRVKAIAGDGTLFVLYHGLYLVKWIAWEFFFRGYMLFGFEKDFGTRAVLISTVPFALMHVGKPELEMLAAVPAGFILCYIALRSRSIWPGVLLHWLVATTLDFAVSTWWHSG
jgi:membrane protease YdiL (CAAX protease family)